MNQLQPMSLSHQMLNNELHVFVNGLRLLKLLARGPVKHYKRT